MVFNGLTNSDLLVYNALIELHQEDQPLPASAIANLVCCHPQTVYGALARLVDYRLIARQRERRGQAYRYRITG